MAVAATESVPLAPRLERAFEVSSVVPLGAWALLHVLDQGRVLFGAAEIGARRHPGAFTLALEALFVWAPLVFHAGLGAAIYAKRRRAREAAPSRRALLAVHRASGLVALAFLADHFVRFRWPVLEGRAYPADAVQRLALELSRTSGGAPLVAAFHLAGVLAIALHLSVGLTRLVERSERYRGSRPLVHAAVAAGVVTGVVGVLSILELAAG